MSLVIFIVVAMVYFFIGGLSCAKIGAIGAAKCSRRNHNADDCGHLWASGASLFLWPMIVPSFLGVNAGLLRQNRDENRRARELVEAKHKAELARLKRIESDELDKQLGR